MSPNDMSEGLREGVSQAAMRLPLAAGLGALLALRPRRAGSPPHDWAVIQTQIVLAIVGALILIIVGASLARAFGIAGAANLIRYRAKIEDPRTRSSCSRRCRSAWRAAWAFRHRRPGHAVPRHHAVGDRGIRDTRPHVSADGQARRRHRLQAGAVERLPRRRRTRLRAAVHRRGRAVVPRGRGRSLKTETLSLALAALAPDGKGQIEWKEEKKARPLADSEEEE
jgi:hypothetical protein